VSVPVLHSFRGFIVEERATGKIAMKWRFRYANPDERSWLAVSTEKGGSEAVEYLRDGIADVLVKSALMFGHKLDKDRVMAFFPPDDGGYVRSTLGWLEMNDLIEIEVVSKEPR
jgi:hypothetical protein